MKVIEVHNVNLIQKDVGVEHATSDGLNARMVRVYVFHWFIYVTYNIWETTEENYKI